MSASQFVLMIFIVIAAVRGQAREQAQSVDCQALTIELKAMKQAQKSLLTNMVQNNETMASTLDQYQGELQQQARKKRPISAQNLTSLKRSASAFRQHKTREGQLVERFDQASEKLISRVESCLNRI